MPDPILKVLVTGSSGLIGGVVIRTLGDKYTFSGLDRAQTADAPDIPTTVADVSNFDAIRPSFDGMDAVIHLAADAGMHAPWQSLSRSSTRRPLSPKSLSAYGQHQPAASGNISSSWTTAPPMAHANTSRDS